MALRILHLTASYKPAFIYGGPILSVAALAELQAKLGNDVVVYTTTANGTSELDVLSKAETRVNGVKVWYYHRQTKDHSHLSFGLLLKLWINCKRFDVIHVHSWWNLVSLCGMIICRLRGCKNIVFSPRGMMSPYTLQGASGRVKAIFHHLIGKKLLRKVTWHLTSEAEKLEGINGGARSYFVLPNITSVVENRYLPKFKVPSNPLHLGFISRIHPKKGLEITFDAISRLPNGLASLSIYGDGDENYVQELKQKARDLNIDNKVFFKGWLSDEQKPSAFSEIDLFILNSLNENFGNIVEESVRFGVPVLISDQVGAKDLIEEYGLGWVTNNKSLEISTTLQRIAENHSELISRQESILKWINDRPSPRQQAEKYIEQYKCYQSA